MKILLVFRVFFPLTQQAGVKSDSRRRRHRAQLQSCLTPQTGKLLDGKQLFARSGRVQAGTDSCELDGILSTCGSGFYRGSPDQLVELSIILVTLIPWKLTHRAVQKGMKQTTLTHTRIFVSFTSIFLHRLNTTPGSTAQTVRVQYPRDFFVGVSS